MLCAFLPSKGHLSVAYLPCLPLEVSIPLQMNPSSLPLSRMGAEWWEGEQGCSTLLTGSYMNMHALYCGCRKKTTGYKDGPAVQKVLILLVLLPAINSQKNLSLLWSHHFQCPFSGGGREASMGN